MRRTSAFQSWVREEIVLGWVLAAGLTFFATADHLRTTYDLPEARLVLDTAAVIVAGLVSVLAGVRFSVDRRRLDLLLSGGYAVSAVATFSFGIAPLLGGSPLHRTEAWAGVAGRVVAAALIAAAPFVRGRIPSPRRALGAFALVGVLLVLLWLGCRLLGDALPRLVPGTSDDQPPLLTVALAVQSQLSLLAVVGFGYRLRVHGHDLDRWLALSATITLFAQLNYVFTPLLSSDYVSQGDFLNLLAYGILVVGVWRAIRSAEFGRVVAEERARVAREIHDGLAQYLFAISTQVSLLEGGGEQAKIVPRLKEAADAAQQEARFAVLALSSAAGTAPFDAALRRYVDFLTADGALEVDLEIEPGLRLGPDEQIEIFRIVQEGLANVRRHAGARRAEVLIGHDAGRRRVLIRDDGQGFDDGKRSGGQGLSNMETRASAIGGRFKLSARPGRGTSLEVTLRT